MFKSEFRFIILFYTSIEDKMKKGYNIAWIFTRENTHQPHLDLHVFFFFILFFDMVRESNDLIRKLIFKFSFMLSLFYIDPFYFFLFVFFCKKTNTKPNKRRFNNTFVREKMYPLSLLFSTKGQEILVELRNGDTYNGTLSSCDAYMNLNLEDVYRTSKDGDRFWEIPEVYIRGSSIKYLRIPDEVIDNIDEEKVNQEISQQRGGYRGGGRNQNKHHGGRDGGTPYRGGKFDIFFSYFISSYYYMSSLLIFGMFTYFIFYSLCIF